MDFEELLELLNNPGEDGAPDDIFDQLRGAHTGAIAGKDEEINSGAEALAAVQAQVDSLSQQLLEVKAANFDSLMSAGTVTESDPDLNDETFDEADSEGEMNDEDFFAKKDD